MELVIKEGVSPRGMPISEYTEIDSCDLYFMEDIEKMVAAFKEAGYEISILTAYAAHCIHDNDYCASWLSLPDTPDIVKTYLPYLI